MIREATLAHAHRGEEAEKRQRDERPRAESQSFEGVFQIAHVAQLGADCHHRALAHRRRRRISPRIVVGEIDLGPDRPAVGRDGVRNREIAVPRAKSRGFHRVDPALAVKKHVTGRLIRKPDERQDEQYAE